MRMFTALTFMCVFAASAAFAQASKSAQPPKAGRTPKSAPSPKPLIVCPPQSKAACDSFLELWNAGDEDVRRDHEDFGLVCFRQNEDSFFVMLIRSGYIDFDSVKKDSEGNPYIREWPRARGTLESFKDGVSFADTTIPDSLINFNGTWHSFETVSAKTNVVGWTKRPDDAEFYAKPEDNRGAGVMVTSTSVNLSATYKSISEKDVSYDLTVQRSTGRFIEIHTIDKVPTRALGRCVPLPERN